MRDPARIQRIMSNLTTARSYVPDLRFWQLLSAIGYLEYTEIPHHKPLLQDIFHYEDDRLEKCLDEFIEKKTNQDLNDNLTILSQMKKNGEIEEEDLLY